MIYILPYKAGSQSAKALAEALQSRLIKLEGSRFKPSRKKVVLNWGNNDVPVEYLAASLKVLNGEVKDATNKLSFFNRVAGKEWCIPFTEDKAVAQQWIDEGKMVVCRTMLNAHSGRGIVLSDQNTPLVDAPLYTQYIKKESEYRIHVFAASGATFVQKKVRNKDIPDDDVNWQIRNHDNGFVFATGDEYIQDMPADVKQVAIEAIQLLNLDFGAVDVIWNDRQQRAYVLEINTAPGLEPEGKTLDFYRRSVEYLKDMGLWHADRAIHNDIYAVPKYANNAIAARRAAVPPPAPAPIAMDERLMEEINAFRAQP